MRGTPVATKGNGGEIAMESGSEAIVSEVCSPVPEVYDPQARVGSSASRWARRGAFGAVVLGALMGLGCNSGGANQSSTPIVLGMTDSVTPVYNTAQLTLYEVQVPVPLPVEKPTAQQEAALGGPVAPYPHEPFLLNSDISLEVHYTITNLDSQRHSVYLLLDPWNEFVRYKPGVQYVSDDETLPNLSGYENSILIDGDSRVQGTVTTDDTIAMAIGLAAAMDVMSQPANAMATYSQATLIDHIFNIQNRPISNDPLVSQYVPSVIAGLTGFDLGLRSDSPENIAIEIIVDITDLSGDRLVPQGQTESLIGLPPAVLTPPLTPPPTDD
jgi:hypothetical protein